MNDITLHTKKSLSFSKEIVKNLPPAISKRLPKDIAIITVSLKESLALNRRYRHKRKPANVLSFLYDNTLLSSPLSRGSRLIPAKAGIEIRNKRGSGFLRSWSGVIGKKKNTHAYGEIILCPAIIRKEAKEQSNTEVFQMTWMLVHGMLHLAGLHHEYSRVLAGKVARIEHEVLSALEKKRKNKE